MLTSLSVGAPRDDGYIDAIRQAASGDDASLKRWLTGVGKVVHRYTAAELSQGLHASTLCADWPAPWGDASAPSEGREAALNAAADKLTEADLYPYDRETATAQRLRAAVPVLAAGRRSPSRTGRATSRTSRRCCSTATATSRRRTNGPSRRSTPRAGRPADDRQGRRPRRPGPGRPEGAGRGPAARSIARVNATRFDDLIRTRRTHKAFGPDPVPDDVLLELFELARWAPNHHLTDPWRFRVLGPEARAALKQVAEDAKPGSGSKLDRAPTLIAVGAKQTGDAGPGSRGRARHRRGRLHRPDGRPRPRARRLLAHGGGDGDRRRPRGARRCPPTSCRSACCTSATRARSSASRTARPVEEIAFFLD